ncbi:MAG: hypothetical protein HYS32_02075 [Candidatus Woesearchaeota archaeon]|nr:MAG: hypothetical protein HYS32_02075 [Candidatus Woesearchaeota archaeon]
MLGDGSIYAHKNQSQVSICGNLKEKEYMIGYVKPLFEGVFKIRFNIKFREYANGLYVYKNSKSLVFTLNKYGLVSGNKKSKGAKIPPWIFSNKSYLRACLRGIIDTDGCVYPRNNTNLYPNIWVSSAIPSLRISITKAFNKLGFSLSSWKEGRNYASIRRRSEVERYYKEIGFSNPKHLIRFQKFMIEK